MKRVVGDVIFGALVLALVMKIVSEVISMGPVSIGLAAPMMVVVLLMGAASVVAAKPDF